MKKSKKEVNQQELIVLGSRFDKDCSNDEFIERVERLIKLARSDGFANSKEVVKWDLKIL